MNAAKSQWVAVPKDCPLALYLLGKISEINTQITVPWPIACEATKIRINDNNNDEFKLYKKQTPIENKLIIYPTDPMYIKNFLP